MTFGKIHENESESVTQNVSNKNQKETLHHFDVQNGNKHDTVQIWLQKLKNYISNHNKEQQKYKKNRIRNRFSSGLQGVWGVPGRR